MLVIAGVITLDATKRDEAIAAATVMMSETRKENGCISYTFSADLENPGSNRFHEKAIPLNEERPGAATENTLRLCTVRDVH